MSFKVGGFPSHHLTLPIIMSHCFCAKNYVSTFRSQLYKQVFHIKVAAILIPHVYSIYITQHCFEYNNNVYDWLLYGYDTAEGQSLFKRNCYLTMVSIMMPYNGALHAFTDIHYFYSNLYNLVANTWPKHLCFPLHVL